MQFSVCVHGQQVEVEGTPTDHPELAIHEIGVATGDDAPRLGTVWAVSHVPTGTVVLHGLLTKELATMAARMLTASGIKFGPGHRLPYVIDLFQAAAQAMTDAYFSTFYSSPERGSLAHA